MKHIPGVGIFPDNDYLLLELIIVDEEYRAAWYNVEAHDVHRACAEFNLPYDKVHELIRSMSHDVHTILIHVPDYIAYLEAKE